MGNFFAMQEAAGVHITNVMQRCCQNPALFVQQLSAFTINVLVLQPMLKVASCGTWQAMALTVRAMVKELCRVLDSERALLDFVCTSIIVPTRNVLGSFGPLPSFKGKAYDVQASGPDLTELVRTGGVQGATDRHLCRTNEDARGSEDLDAVSESSEDEDEDDCDAEQVAQPMIATAAAINAAAPPLAGPHQNADSEVWCLHKAGTLLSSTCDCTWQPSMMSMKGHLVNPARSCV
jgi:hypothetical protein